MTLMLQIVLGLAMGIAFGVALEKSRVFEPGVIVGQMQLRNFIMLKVMLTAIATGMVVLIVLTATGLAELGPKATFWGATALGGLLLGAGIVVAVACPGTAMAQVGAGYRDAWFTVAGALGGAIAFGYAEPMLKPALLSGGPGAITLHGLLGLPYWVVAGIAALALVAVLAGLERLRSWDEEVGPDLDGLSR